MTGTEISLILTAGGTFLTALGGVVIGILNKFKIEQVHQTTNSKMDAMLSLTAQAAHAAGVKEEKDRAV